ncbi:MAG: M2 family metallopeptidase [Bacteroidales bacterium]|nr:M2 family metallopeptidase [Bacteroidales bacterium]
MRVKNIISVAAIALAGISCTNQAEVELQQIIDRTVSEYRPLMIESNLAYWNGAITGSEAEFAKYAQANKAISEIFSNTETFNALKQIKESGKVKDAVLKRELDVLYNQFLSRQADTALLHKIIEKEMLLEQKYANFRAMYNGKVYNDNEIEAVLKTSVDNKLLEGVWKAHKAIGDVVAEDVIEVVKLRNELARSLGFNDYYQMSLILSGEDPDEIYAIMDEVNQMTKESFADVKGLMDKKFSERYGVAVEDLMPWHFQNRYFQEAPNLYPVDLDQFYKEADLEKITADYYKSIGLDISEIMANSDLYPKDGKNQHAFCADIDRQGDIRILCNINGSERWMSTMLHEYGHGVYAIGYDANPQLPFLLREAAGIFTTEAIAMLFERQSVNPQWMKTYIGISQEQAESIAEDCRNSARLKQLVFSRWVQVVSRFERGMYADPDQDLNKLWWDLAQEYQLLNKPQGRDEPDWATKIHIALYPCYYHNYQLGELFASQLHYYIVDNITKSGDYIGDTYIGNKEVGKWLNENVFAPGMLYPWNEMIERATGEKLTAKYYREQFQ